MKRDLYFEIIHSCLKENVENLENLRISQHKLQMWINVAEHNLSRTDLALLALELNETEAFRIVNNLRDEEVIKNDNN